MRALLLLLALSGGAALACPQPFLGEVPLTKDGTTILQGGGVVMHIVAGAGTRGEFDVERGGHLVVGDQDLGARSDSIAPGLTVIVPPAQKGRAIELRGPRGARILDLVQGDVAPKHLAPKLARVTATMTAAQAKQKIDPRRGPFGVYGSYTVVLADAPPPDVLALVIYTTGRTPQGIAYALPEANVKEYQFTFGGKNCGTPTSGLLAQGAKVHAAWVDEAGRLSILGKDLVVTAAPPQTP